MTQNGKTIVNTDLYASIDIGGSHQIIAWEPGNADTACVLGEYVDDSDSANALDVLYRKLSQGIRCMKMPPSRDPEYIVTNLDEEEGESSLIELLRNVGTALSLFHLPTPHDSNQGDDDSE